MPELLLALDQGTTNTKALLIDRQGQPIFRTSRPVAIETPQPGFVEQNPLTLWSSAHSALIEAAAHARSLGAKVAAIAISNQRETALAWDRVTGRPLTPAMSWQCRRSAVHCDHFRPQHELIRRSTGLPLDPVLSATKWFWALEDAPEVQRTANDGELCLGTVDSWLLWHLSGGKTHATDLTNASRTGLLDLATLTWNPELLKLFHIPAEALPELVPSASHIATCTLPELAGVPIMAALGDSHAALAGHGNFTPGAIKATYGTGSSLMLLTESLATDTPNLARTIAWSTADQTHYALEGNIFMTGSAVQWVGEFLGLPDPTAGALALADSAASSEGAYFVPAMVGLGAPHWNAEARGLLCGLERSHKAAHLARAAMESIAYQVADVFFTMRSAAGIDLPALRTDGGATRNDTLMQFQADLLGVPVHRSANEELSALGAAYLAGLTLGWWPSLEAITALPRETHTFAPLMREPERSARYASWRNAVRRVTLREETTA